MREKVSESKTLLKQWHYKRNISLNPEKLTQGSSKKAWWICDKFHEWEAVISNRKTRSCPYCSNQKVGSDNNLALLNPTVVKQWHPTKNDNLSPDMVTPGSTRKIWWICDKGHEWEAVIRKRMHPNNPTGCPYCTNRKISSGNNLAFLNPTLAKQWHPTKNGGLSPDIVTPGSARKAWWVCDKGHEWEAAVYSRKKNGCSKCSNQSSESEIRILTELMSIFDDATSRYKIKSLELDVYIPFFNIGIEYDGYYYHKSRESKDRNKNKVLEKEGVFLVRVRQHPLQPISSLDIVHIKDKLTKETLNELMSTLKPLVDKNHSEKIRDYLLETRFVNQSLFNEYMSYFPNPFPENSLEYLFPKLCKEWNYEKNKPLLPSNFSQGSGRKVWWICQKGHEWETTIDTRTVNNCGCPYCAGRTISTDNNLEFLNPKVAKQWHPTKNGSFSPNMFTQGSHKRAWWVCSKGHEWETVIYSRKTRGCPYCAGKKISSDNNLAFINPTLAKQWHLTKNNDLSSDMVTPGSEKKAWWICDKGHEWEARINSRKTRGCPYCARRKR
jgi:hypothetical protein